MKVRTLGCVAAVEVFFKIKNRSYDKFWERRTMIAWEDVVYGCHGGEGSANAF